MGFHNPALDSAEAFRTILNAMARPGRIAKLSQPQSPAPLADSTWALLLTLADNATSIFLPPHLALPALLSALQFHTGTRQATEAGQASFVLTDETHARGHLAQCDMGTAEYPDRSATLIIQCDALTRQGVVLSGPGIKDTQGFGATGLDPEFWNALSERHQHYPRGTDVFFTAPGHIAAIPRSTRIEVR